MQSTTCIGATITRFQCLAVEQKPPASQAALNQDFSKPKFSIFKIESSQLGLQPLRVLRNQPSSQAPVPIPPKSSKPLMGATNRLSRSQRWVGGRKFLYAGHRSCRCIRRLATILACAHGQPSKSLLTTFPNLVWKALLLFLYLTACYDDNQQLLWKTDKLVRLKNSSCVGLYKGQTLLYNSFSNLSRG